MKNLKTKIGLSVLALACVGAGAFNFQTNVSANAEAAATTATLVMNNGAEICVSDDFSGIRWATTIKAGEDFAGQTVRYGVVVAPTADIEGELTLETAEAVDLRFTTDGIAQDAENDVTYYSVINYDNLTENQAAAYALELTARAYAYNVNEDTIVYSDISEVSTSRSARQIAIHADVTGQLDGMEADKVTKAVSYYGATERTTLSAKQKAFIARSAFVVDAENYAGSTEFEIDLGTATPQEVIIGAESVAFEYAEGKLNVKDVNFVKDGEYYMTIFTDSEIVIKPFIKATKVLTKTDDLMMFRAKGVKNDGTTTKVSGYANWNRNQEFGGYYVLGNDITADKLADGTTAYKHGSLAEDGTFNNTSWNGADKYTKADGTPYEIGLTGTFNGMGYTIDKLTIGTEAEGFFGIVNQGTVKNVAFTTVKRGVKKSVYMLANYLINATIENVFIDTYKFEYTNTAVLANYAYGELNMTNCVIRYRNDDGYEAKAALFAAYKAATYNFENVFLYAQAAGTFYTDEAVSTETITTPDDETTPDVNEEVKTTTWALKTVNFLPLVVSSQATPRTVNAETGEMSGDIKKGKIVVAQNQVDENGAPLASTGIVSALYDVEVINGIYSYTNTTDWINASHNYDSFNAAGVWSTSSGVPKWK